MTSDPATAPPSKGAIASVLDSVGFTRAQFWVLMLIMAGEFFDTLEQNSVGAMGTNIKDSLHIGDVQLTTINTVTVIGGLFGRLLAGWLADRYGRRFALGLNLLIYTLGGILSALSFSYGMLLVSRFIVGIGVGGEFMIGIAMISEMVSTRNRGTLVASINVGAGGVGNFISYGLFLLLLGPLAAPLGGNGTVWRWSFVLLALPALLVVFYRRRLPETPRWLLYKGRVADANRSLGILTSNSLRATGAVPPVELTAADIPPVVAKGNPAEVFERRLIGRTVAIGIASWMAFGCQVTLNFLMPTLLVERGYTVSQSLLYTMIMNVGALLGACVAALIANRVGRRRAVSVAGVLGCITALGVRGVRPQHRGDPRPRRVLHVLYDDHQHHAGYVDARALPDQRPLFRLFDHQRHRQHRRCSHAVRGHGAVRLGAVRRRLRAGCGHVRDLGHRRPVRPRDARAHAGAGQREHPGAGRRYRPRRLSRPIKRAAEPTMAPPPLGKEAQHGHPDHLGHRHRAQLPAGVRRRHQRPARRARARHPGQGLRPVDGRSR